MRRSILGGLAAVAALALLGSAVASTTSASLASASPTRGKTAGMHCVAAANARVMKGTSQWADPNTLTRQEAAALEAQNHRIVARSGIQTRARPNGSVRIRVHFHGITDRGGHGFVSKARFYAQILVLNEAFAGHASAN